MQINTDLTGLAGITLAIIAVLLRLPFVRNLPLKKKAGLSLAAIVVVSIPLWGLSLAGLVRGITGDLSIVTLVLLALALAQSVSGLVLVETQNRQIMLRIILLVAVLFYPLVLGWGTFDPYRMGYGNVGFVVALAGLAICMGLTYSTLCAVCLALAATAWSIGWYESTNLWDYLLDPWLAFYALAVQVTYLLGRWKGKAHV